MKFNSGKLLLLLISVLFFSNLIFTQNKKQNNIIFSISFPEELYKGPIDGRVLVMVSNDSTKEPRFQISEDQQTQLVFGIDVNNFKPGEKILIGEDATGYPLETISDIPAGTYWVQALINKYETFNRADGHLLKLPMDDWEGQHWNISPGNFYSSPVEIKIVRGKKDIVELKLEKIIPPVKEFKETKYIKHIRIRSELLSKFWGRDMYIGAYVLIPYGFDEHPEAHYPLMVNHGHFPFGIFAFRETPPDADLKPEYSERFRMEGYNKIVQEYSYENYKSWIDPDFPRFLVIEIEHSNPYYDDSYAVNSENLGPYGDAINYELIPFIEKKFRGIGEGWARFTYGGSTGGWEALATQIFYPDMYNGCFAACPDPIDFQAYTVVNIYNDKNAYYLDSPWLKTHRPGKRNYLGHVSSTLKSMNQLEMVLGSKSRSGGQWDIWQAVFSPSGTDGYPQPIWNKKTGEIDHKVAQYWKEHFDLTYIMKRDWKILGPKLKGKIHIYCGSMDSYYLNNAVYLTEEFLKNTKDPYYDGEVTYGNRAEHCWNGDPDLPNAISRLRYNIMYLPKILEQINKTAPEGADLESWIY